MPRISEKKAAAKSSVPRLPSGRSGGRTAPVRRSGAGGCGCARRRRRAAAAAAAKQPSVAADGPAPVVALDDRQRDQPPGRAPASPRPAGRAGGCRGSWRSSRRRAAGEQDRGAERQVDEEDEAPVGELDQGAAEGRADRRRGRRGGAPEADPGGAPLDREAVEDDRQRGRRDHRRADPLQDAEGDQQLERGRHRAEQAGGGEAGDAEQEDRACGRSGRRARRPGRAARR